MHIADGFVSTPVWGGLGATGIVAVGILARRVQRELAESAVPRLGVMGAFVFAAQMINFPIAAGTSGHLVGSALLTYRLGAAPAALVMLSIAGILLVTAGVLVASAAPDSLDWLTEEVGLAERARNLFETSFADYPARFIAWPWLAQATAGLAAGAASGVILTIRFGL